MTTALRRCAESFGCRPDASDAEVVEVILRAHADGDLVWSQVTELRDAEGEQ